MSNVLIALLPVLLLWIVFRVGTRAVGPLLADVRAAGGRQQRLLPRPSAAALPTGLGLALVRALVVGGGTIAIYVALANLGLFQTMEPITFALSYGFTYRYYPVSDLGLVAGVALGLAVFATGWRAALIGFVALYALAFAFDAAFNVVGAMNFPTESDFYGGGPLGQNLWVVYYAGYGAAVAAGLSLVSLRYRAVLPWLTLIAAGGLAQILVANQTTFGLEALIYPYLIPPVFVAAAAGWWMARPGRR